MAKESWQAGERKDEKGCAGFSFFFGSSPSTLWAARAGFRRDPTAKVACPFLGSRTQVIPPIKKTHVLGLKQQALSPMASEVTEEAKVPREQKKSTLGFPAFKERFFNNY